MSGRRAHETILKEIVDAESRLLEVRRIRVTPDAFAGSPVLAMIPPERLRKEALRAFPGGVVDADLEPMERWREIIVHPQDWAEVLREMTPVSGLETKGGRVIRLFGIEVEA